MLLQPRLLHLDTLQEVEEVQLLRSNVTDDSANVITPTMYNVLPPRSAPSDAITTTKKIPFGVPIIL